MKVVLISDTHGEHASIHVPEGDVLIHAGDLTASGKASEIEAAAKWLGSLSHPYKIAIAGNHDLLFESSPAVATAILRNAGVAYLQDAGTSVEELSIYGSPWQPEYMHWAFRALITWDARSYWPLFAGLSRGFMFSDIFMGDMD